MLLALVLLCVISDAHSTHFRGGIIMTRPQPGGMDYEVIDQACMDVYYEL